MYCTSNVGELFIWPLATSTAVASSIAAIHVYLLNPQHDYTMQDVSMLPKTSEHTNDISKYSVCAKCKIFLWEHIPQVLSNYMYLINVNL